MKLEHIEKIESDPVTVRMTVVDSIETVSGHDGKSQEEVDRFIGERLRFAAQEYYENRWGENQ